MKAIKWMSKARIQDESQGNLEFPEMHLRFNPSSTHDKDPPNIKRQSDSSINNLEIFSNEIRRSKNIRLDSGDKF